MDHGVIGDCPSPRNLQQQILGSALSDQDLSLLINSNLSDLFRLIATFWDGLGPEL